jgi:hypothetical protein
MKHYYDIDLRDLLAEDDPLEPRWALMHAANLPIASSFVAVRRGGLEYRGWGPEQYAFADMVDGLSDLAYILILANRDPDKPMPAAPSRYPRPGSGGTKEAVTDDKKTSFKPGSFGAMMQQAKINRRKKLAQEAAEGA